MRNVPPLVIQEGNNNNLFSHVLQVWHVGFDLSNFLIEVDDKALSGFLVSFHLS